MTPRSALNIAALALGLALPSFAQGAEVTPSKVKASSMLPEADGISYAPEKTLDKQAGTMWIEGEETAGLGEYVQYDFPATTTISSIEIRPGNFYSKDFWTRHNRVKEVQVKFQTGSPQRFILDDKQEVQVIKLEAPVKTRFVRIILKGVYQGTTFNDTCISEVRFFSPDVDPLLAPVKTASASSVFPGFPAVDATDGMKDTLWCEQVEGSGLGESLKLELEGESSIKGIRVINGTGAAKAAFARNNRVSKLKIATEGGEMSGSVADTFGEAQELLFPAPVKGSTVTVTIEGVTKGLDYDDTCLAEVQVLRAPAAAPAK